MDIILGLVMIYTTIHAMAMQNTAYSKRTDYQKVVTWLGGISIVLVFIGVMFG